MSPRFPERYAGQPSPGAAIPTSSRGGTRRLLRLVWSADAEHRLVRDGDPRATRDDRAILDLGAFPAIHPPRRSDAMFRPHDRAAADRKAWLILGGFAASLPLILALDWLGLHP